MIRRLFPVALTLLLLLGISASHASAEEAGKDDTVRFPENEFPIVAFSVDGNHDKLFAHAKAMGITHVHTYAMGVKGDGKFKEKSNRAYLDAAHRAGLKVMVNLGGRHVVLKENGPELLKAYVETFKDHPAVGFWYLYDEPDLKEEVTPAMIGRYRDLLHEWTPEIPVAVAVAWSHDYLKFAPVVDVLMGDNYPVTGNDFPDAKINQPMRFGYNCIRTGTPYMPIQQMFNWYVFGKGKKEYRGAKPKDLRFPNFTELRYFCFASLAAGSRGLSWWSHYRGITSPGGWAWIRGPFAAANSEFSQFVKLVEPAQNRTFFPRAMDIDIFLALWQRDHGQYLVVVNNWPRKRKVQRRMKDKVENADLIPWGRTRVDALGRIEKGMLTVTMEPWETMIFSLREPKGKPVKENENE